VSPVYESIEMNSSEYAKIYQDNTALDAASLEAHIALVKSLNDLILKAAREKLKIDDEPSDFDRLILGPKS
jgi:hypothetical protein